MSLFSTGFIQWIEKVIHFTRCFLLYAHTLIWPRPTERIFTFLENISFCIWMCGMVSHISDYFNFTTTNWCIFLIPFIFYSAKAFTQRSFIYINRMADVCSSQSICIHTQWITFNWLGSSLPFFACKSFWSTFSYI